MIQDGSTVRIHYTLTVDGEVVDSSQGKDPLEYAHGGGQIIAGLEQELVGLKVGDKKDVSVSPAQGYGVTNPEAFQEVPASAFENAENLNVGDMVAGASEGKEFHARIHEVSGDKVTLDLNHPLAGKTLQFAIEVVSIA